MTGWFVTSIRVGLAAGSGLATAAALAGIAASVQFPFSPRVVDLELGREVFAERCANCHKLGQSQGLGPALDGPRGWAATRVPGMNAEEYILQSIITPSAYRAPGTNGEMPDKISAGLSDDKLASVAAYVCSLSSPVNYSKFARLETRSGANLPDRAQKLDLASVERGRELYLQRLQCAACHPLDGAPGSSLAAPGLLQAGAHARSYLETSILAPGDHVVAGYEVWQLSKGGTVHTGRRLNAENTRVRLLTTDIAGSFQLESFELAELDALDDDGNLVAPISQSSMPVSPEPPSREDLDCLLDFLMTLR